MKLKKKKNLLKKVIVWNDNFQILWDPFYGNYTYSIRICFTGISKTLAMGCIPGLVISALHMNLDVVLAPINHASTGGVSGLDGNIITISQAS